MSRNLRASYAIDQRFKWKFGLTKSAAYVKMNEPNCRESLTHSPNRSCQHPSLDISSVPCGIQVGRVAWVHGWPPSSMLIGYKTGGYAGTIRRRSRCCAVLLMQQKVEHIVINDATHSSTPFGDLW